MSDDLADRLLSRAFDRSQVTAVRWQVSREARRVGLSEVRGQDFTLAVDEILTNAVRHGGGKGHLELWAADGRLWFRVTDTGPGLVAEPPLTAPSPTQVGGRGLWIAYQMTDTLKITSGPGGTVVVGAVAIGGGHAVHSGL